MDVMEILYCRKKYARMKKAIEWSVIPAALVTFLVLAFAKSLFQFFCVFGTLSAIYGVIMYKLIDVAFVYYINGHNSDKIIYTADFKDFTCTM